MKSTTEQAKIIKREHFAKLIEVLQKQGYQTIGPTVREQAIIYDEIAAVEDFPIGVTDEHEGGRYRLQRGKGRELFGFVVGPNSWKKFLYPARLRLLHASKNGSALRFEGASDASPKYAFLGVRACELSAIAIQDKVFTSGEFADPVYQQRRQDLFIVAVNCTRPGGTCFCASMGTGPEVSFGYDLALTEVVEEKAHYFVVDVGSEKGTEVVEAIPTSDAGEAHLAAAKARVDSASRNMGRQMDTQDIKELLYRNYESPDWEEVANRCLTCTNCTLVCPTCFCSTVEDVTDLTGEHAERWRSWDSCFTQAFSYVHGGSIRTGAAARYRQWLTHKLATWIDQFGASGCVGCGRCITWCPVGIDITQEVAAIRKSDKKND